MFVYYFFLTVYKGQGNARNDAKKPQRMDAYSESLQRNTYSLQRSPNSLQRESSKSKDQLHNLSLLAAAKIPLTAVKTRCPDLLEHKTLGYKRGHSSHF